MSARKSLLFVFIAAVLFSVSGLCVKLIPWNPMSINSFRSLISCAMLFTFAKVTGHKLRLSWGIFGGACAMTVTTFLYAFAIKLTTAGNAILLQFSAPVFVIFFMWLCFHEKPKRLDVITCVIVFFGIGCFFLDGLGGGSMLGNGLALLSGVGYAWIFLMGKIPNGDPLISVMLGHGMGGLIGFPWLVQETDFNPEALIAAICLGVFGLGLAYIFFTAGIKYAPPVSAALVTGIEPILNPVLVAIFVGEMLSTLSLIGGAIVFVTIMVYNVIEAKQDAKALEDAQNSA